MESINTKKWEDLNLSRDELNNLGQALKQEEFRNLLLDYVKEISDPENRKQYESDITQLEKERGNDVTFVHPTSGYVIKTSVDGKRKAFINICSNKNVGAPSSVPGTNEGQHGLQWSIPYCLAPPRDDYDKKKNVCNVFDVVFHPDTLHMTKSNQPFKKLVEETALNGIEDNFRILLDKVNLRYPKMEFKGAKQATVIRKRIQNFQPSEDVLDIPNYPYPPLSTENTDQYKPKLKNQMQTGNTEEKIHKNKYTTPKYSIKYRSNVDIQNYANDPISKMMATVPSEIVITIDLPLLKCSADADIDVTETYLTLVSNNSGKYKLQLKLPYLVDQNKGNAKYDLDKKVLTITLPVVGQKSNTQLESKEDSGIGCDNWNSTGEDNPKQMQFIENERDTEISHNVPVSKDCEEHEINSNLSSKTHYTLPSFDLNLVNKKLIVTLEVPNVTPDSVNHTFLESWAGFHISFLSMGNGYFPVNYALCLTIPDPTKILPENFSVEVWDNNVTVHFELKSITQEFFVFIGSTKSSLKKYTIHHDLVDSVQSVSKKIEDEPTSATEIKTDNAKDGSLSGSSSESSSPCHRHTPKSRTHSESQNGEPMRKTRGILKIGRSLSESSIDEYASWSDEKVEKAKKTVRFSDVISKQTFRMNSSILGQRKKNQKKNKYKKRVQERRLSESGCDSEGDSETPSNSELWINDADSSSCSASDVSEVSDVSESDDGQKDDFKVSMPCSSKKNHKRRGKKSARKNAATAKIQFRDH